MLDAFDGSHVQDHRGFDARRRCASTPHTTPDEMSAANHRAEAQREAAEARALSREEVPVARDDVSQDTASPEAAEIAEHYRAAAAHGTAAETLIADEASVCSSVPASDRETNPFSKSERIASVVPLRFRSSQPAGAAVTFTHRADLTEEGLRQQVRCQMARVATRGYESAELGESPLFLRGIRAEVTSSDDAVRVRIVSDDPATAREILRRCEALARAPSH